MKLSLPIGLGLLLAAMHIGSVEAEGHLNLRHDELNPLMKDAHLGAFRLTDSQNQRKMQMDCLDQKVQKDTGCIGDATKAAGNISLKDPRDLNCRANDVVIARARATEVIGEDGNPKQPIEPCDELGLESCFKCTEDEQLLVKLVTDLQSSSSERRSDIGLWLDQNHEGDAVSGVCNHVVFPAGHPPEQGGLPDFDAGAGKSDGCGDVALAQLFDDVALDSVLIKCGSDEPEGETQTVVVPYCIGWKIPGQDDICPGGYVATSGFTPCELGTTPGTRSKCKCGRTKLNIFVEKCKFRAECKPLTNPPVEGCSFDDNDGLPDKKAPDEVFDITTNGSCEEYEVDVTDWSPGGGNLCDNDLTAKRTYTLTPPSDAPDRTIVECEETVLIQDTIPPVIPWCPKNLDKTCKEAIPEAATVTATDRCGVELKFDCCLTGSGDTFLLERNWVATDICGKKAECNQDIRIICVNDETA